MATYVALLSFTPQGIAEVKKSPERASQFRSEVESAGGKVRDIFWTLGAFDGVAVFDAPDENAATALLLRLGQKCNVSTQTLRAFDAAAFDAVLKKI